MKLRFKRLRTVNAACKTRDREQSLAMETTSNVIQNGFKRFTFVSLQVNLKTSLPGPLGERGINGSKGSKGDTGLIGPPGLQGAKGPPGEKGTKGNPGDKGNPGAKGTKGFQGDKGHPGTSGVNGITGPQGAPGAPGPGGIGNFSWCEHKVVEVPKAQAATVKDTVVRKSCVG